MANVRRQQRVTTMNPVSALPQTATVVVDGVEDEPTSVTLAAPYGFYDDNGVLQFWAAGQTVTDAEQIALLISVGAVFEPA